MRASSKVDSLIGCHIDLSGIVDTMRSQHLTPTPRSKPGPAQAKFGKSGDLEIQKFWIHKMKKVEILKFQIRSAQNVGKVWISWKKILLAPFGSIPGHFLHGQKKCKQMTKFAYFHWWANGPYSPGLGVGVRCCMLASEQALRCLIFVVLGQRRIGRRD